MSGTFYVEKILYAGNEVDSVTFYENKPGTERTHYLLQRKGGCWEFMRGRVLPGRGVFGTRRRHEVIAYRTTRTLTENGMRGILEKVCAAGNNTRCDALEGLVRQD